MKLSSVYLLLSSVLLFFSCHGAANISEEVYNKLIHYGHFCKLAHCITKPGMLTEGLPFPNGGCLIEFCKKERNSEAEVALVHVADTTGSGTSFVAIDKKNKEIVVSFRASSTSADWISDFYIVQVPYRPVSGYSPDVPCCEGCKVHLGFYRHIQTIYLDVIDPVLDLFKKHPDFKLVIVGHSLGAAMASLTAIEFKMLGFMPLVYTYGGPKTFNEEMSNWVNEIFESEEVSKKLKQGDHFSCGFLRIVHAGDYIPVLPPKFSQAGVELLISKKELPHTIDDVKVIGVDYTEDINSKTTDTLWEVLHGFEHRTYFLTINKCEDVDDDTAPA